MLTRTELRAIFLGCLIGFWIEGCAPPPRPTAAARLSSPTAVSPWVLPRTRL
jgi:hypothetical protein